MLEMISIDSRVLCRKAVLSSLSLNNAPLGKDMEDLLGLGNLLPVHVIFGLS
jgi:hypothetical protein